MFCFLNKLMEERQEEKRFVCKICSKSCFSGKSLGGHMRGHLATISAKKQKAHKHRNMDLEGYVEEPNNVLGVSASTHELEKLKKSDMDLEDGSQASYGLRENPKKSWRVSDGKHSIARKENHCKECGKDFSSLRALSGHMRCHPIKNREPICKQCGKGFDSMRALFGHMRHHSKRSRALNESGESQSDSETLCPIRRKRSRTRYKSSGNFSSSNLNSSSCVSEIDEGAEAALCLMMLSRGLRNWAEFNSVLESSENDSVVLKAKALNQSKGIDVCQSGELERDADGTWKLEKMGEKLDSVVSCSEDSLCGKYESKFGDLDSEFVSHNEEKTGLEVSVDDEFKKFVMDDESGIGSYDSEVKKGTLTEVELVKEDELDQTGSEMLKSNSSKEASFDVQDHELGGNFCDGTRINHAESTSVIINDSQKTREHRCRPCNKSFHSCRALGGRRASHKTLCNGFVVKDDSHERSIKTNVLLSNTEANFKLEGIVNSVEQDTGREAMVSQDLKKSKDHACPICFKVFSSGQALGGHKRAHYVGFCEDKAKEIVLTKQELSEIHNIFDLNLPVTLEKEVNDGGVGLKPWWVGSDHECEPLVISFPN